MIWTEAISEYTLYTRMLPRVWALAERTWANPPSADKADSLAGYNVWS